MGDSVDVKRLPYEWVVPGDRILELRPGAVCSIGRGLRQDRQRVIATRFGQYVCYEGKHYIITDEKAYMPRNEEIVIGIVKRGGGFLSGYTVDIGASGFAKLDAVAFDGASKRLRPELKPGAAVYCRIVNAQRDIDIELSCCSMLPNKKDWMTGESLFGELKGGVVVRLRPSFCRTLLQPDNEVLNTLGTRLAFECCVGVNGMAWIRAREIASTAMLARCLTDVQAVLYGGDDTDTATPRDVIDELFPPAAPRKRRRVTAEDLGDDDGDDAVAAAADDGDGDEADF